MEHNLKFWAINRNKKPGGDQHTSRIDIETSPKASIDRHRPTDIDRQRQMVTDRHHPLDIDRFPLLDEPPCCIVEMEPIEKRMHEYEASHLAVHEHLRPHICTEEAVGFHKRVKKIHDPVKSRRWCKKHHFGISARGDNIRKVWGKEVAELEEEKKDQGRSSVITYSSIIKWCQEVQSAHLIILTAIRKTSSTPYC
ncbi:hypothetical protein DY000_02058644 [Brassica cretica]|uniref:Uncharacterized protein n=1 Tax=Brassica cretica TaxID=69181 RepID=A0ABQ7AXW9_BRACR|nr:hypothetical protein DY000_02058644 [Brassica cretica]